MSILKEFRDFAVKGNVVDLAIGVIIGAAFGKITDSLVNDIFNPIIGLLAGKMDFSQKFVALGPTKSGVIPTTLAEAKAGSAPVLTYGNFINVIINFLIIAFVTFLIVKAVNRWRATPEAVATPPTTTENLLTEIRDLLKEERSSGH